MHNHLKVCYDKIKDIAVLDATVHQELAESRVISPQLHGQNSFVLSVNEVQE